MKIKPPYSDKQISVLLYLFGILIQWIYFKGYITDPNNLMVGFGGDPYVIYTDMVNHICNGSGIMLDFMNYPYGESIFMTDMQASFTLVFQWINHNIFEICDYVPGLIHSTIMLLMPLTIVFIFKTFRKFGTYLWISIVFSLLIAYLSPQLFRFRGQLSLVYPFLVPMSIYWLVDLYNRKNAKIKDLFFGFVLFFFMLNNAYTGLIATAPLIAGGLTLLLFKQWKKGGKIMLAGLVPLLLGYIIIKSTDPFDDRLGLQWGSFYYNLSWQSIFYPNLSLLHDFIENFTSLEKHTVGKRVNFGLGNILICILLIITIVKAFFTHKKYPKLDPPLIAIFGSALMCLIYAMNSNLVPGIQDFTETHLKELLMFKAAGRLGWVSYYAFSIFGVVLIDRILKYSPKKSIVIGLVSIIAVAWSIETHLYLHKSFKKSFYNNHFINKTIDKELDNIDISKYEAIYTIPPLQTWNDKIQLPAPWATQYSALMLSAKTGLPLINAQLSRAPVMSSTSAASIASNPVLPKPRLKKLTPKKPILLVKGEKIELTEGQKYLLDNSSPSGKFLRSSLFEMPAELAPLSPDLKDTSDYFIHYSFEDTPYVNTMVGYGANHIAKGESVNKDIFTLDSIPYFRGELIEVSFWYHISTESYHNPKSTLVTNDKRIKFSDRSSTDFYKDWRNHKAQVIYKGGPLSINTNCKVAFTIDELHIQAVKDTTHFIHPAGILFYNGYPTE